MAEPSRSDHGIFHMSDLFFEIDAQSHLSPAISIPPPSFDEAVHDVPTGKLVFTDPPSSETENSYWNGTTLVTEHFGSSNNFLGVTYSYSDGGGAYYDYASQVVSRWDCSICRRLFRLCWDK